MPEVKPARPEVVGKLKQKYAPANPVRKGRALQVNIASPTYRKLNGSRVVAHFECYEFVNDEQVMRYVGDVVETEGEGFRIAEIFREET